MEHSRIIDRVLARLGFKVLAMAQKQGNLKGFTFYTLNKEPASHKPHIHVCVAKNDKHYKGKPLAGEENLQTIVSIILKPTGNYTPDSLEFEQIYDPKALTTRNKKIWCEWLNALHKLKIPNNIKSIADYLEANPDSKFKSKYERQIYE